jgi:hypothetical protein
MEMCFVFPAEIALKGEATSFSNVVLLNVFGRNFKNFLGG